MPEFLDEKEKRILELETRKKVYTIVKKFAGCHYREIERKSQLAAGTVKYHLSYLVRNGLLTERKNGNVRYYPRAFKPGNKMLLGLLRQKSVRQILLFIFVHDNCNHEQIVRSGDLSPSTVSWHLKKLKEGNIISIEARGRKSFYTLLADKEEVMNLLIAYRESFLDSLVDNVIEMWEME